MNPTWPAALPAEEVITDAHRLRLLVRTFRETLGRLVRIDAARETRIDYQL